MSEKQAMLAVLKKAKPSLAKKYRVKEPAIFGSYSRDTAIAGKSDVDILVVFSQPIRHHVY